MWSRAIRRAVEQYLSRVERAQCARYPRVALEPLESRVMLTSVLDVDLVSITSAGAQAVDHVPSVTDDELPIAMSDDGNIIVYSSDASNLGGISGGRTQIYVHDRAAGTTTNITNNASISSTEASVSGDGNLIVYRQSGRLHLYNRTTGVTTQLFAKVPDAELGIDVDEELFGSHAVISNDGRFIAFESTSNRLLGFDAAGDPLMSGFDENVFRYEIATERIVLASRAAGGAFGNDDSEFPDISDDGRYIVFVSSASNLVAGDSNGTDDIFRFDTLTGSLQRVSTTVGGTQNDGNSFQPAISGDGQVVAFGAVSSVLDPSLTFLAPHGYVRDYGAGTLELFDVNTAGMTAFGAFFPQLNEDGSRVVFIANPGLLAGTTGGSMFDVFVRDRNDNRTDRISEAFDGTAPDEASLFPSITSDGRFVSFASAATNLMNGDVDGQTDTNGLIDVFTVQIDDIPFDPGVTLVIHGFQLFNDGGDSLLPLAEAIVNETGGDLLDYTIPVEGGLATIAPFTMDPGNREVVLLYDWAAESNELSDGWGEAAGDALFATLVSLDLLDPTAGSGNLPFHIIAHSFGTVVASELIERMAVFNVPVDHVTFLDPHDFDQADLAVDEDQRLFDVGAPDGYGVTVWDNVDFADVYYESRGFNSTVEPDELVPRGRPIPGAFNRLLDGADELPANASDYSLADGGDHSYVWSAFYTGTVLGGLPVGSPMPAAFTDWGMTGYAFSRVANGQSRRPAAVLYGGDQDHRDSEPAVATPTNATAMTNLRSTPQWDPLSIINGFLEKPGGSFEQIITPVPQTDNIFPGWNHHGGGGNGEIVNDGLNNTLRLRGGLDLTERVRTHNTLYVPSHTSDLYLDFVTRRTSGATNLGLRVSLGGTQLTLVSVTDSVNTTRHTIAIPASLRNRGLNLEFELVGGGAGDELMVDYVQFLDSQPTPGVTVVTHGFLPTTGSGDSLLPLAQVIAERTGAVLLDYTITTEGEPATFTLSGPITPDREVVVLFDWAAESNEFSSGWTEAAGDAIFALLVAQGLVSPNSGAANARPYHFIAHSFGSAVTSEVVERFAYFGIPVDHLTYLDPHDFDQSLMPVDGDQRQFDVGWPQFVGGQDGYGVTVWDNVVFADAYYETRGSNDGSLAPDLVVPRGRPIPGAYNHLLPAGSELPDLSVGVAGPYAVGDAAGDHSYVWNAYYVATVTGSLRPDAALPEQRTDYSSTGYAFGRVANGQSGRPVPDFYGADQDHEFSSDQIVLTDSGLPDTLNLAANGLSAAGIINGRFAPLWNPLQIVNGNFDHGGDLAEFPGWVHHGGDGSGYMVPDGFLGTTSLGILELEGNPAADVRFRTHNNLYVPLETVSLSLHFDMQRIEAANQMLQVRLGATVLGTYDIDQTDADFIERCLDIPQFLRDQVHNLTFEIIGEPGFLTTSVVHIDNVMFVDEPCSTVNVISGVKFEDVDGDGHRSAGEPGLQGWNIRLEEPDGTLIRSVTTDVNGAYEFDELDAGDYVVREVQQTGWEATTPESQAFTLTTATSVTADFGNFRTMTISGFKYEDINANGLRDAGEPGLGGWIIELDLNDDGTVDDTEVTDATGFYRFDFVGAGDPDGDPFHSVREQAQAGWSQTAPFGGEHLIARDSGGTRADADFGNFEHMELRGFKYEDVNGNGMRDAGEPGLGGWTIELDLNNDGDVDDSYVTDADGSYVFFDVGLGDAGGDPVYLLREVLRDGWEQTAGDDLPRALESGVLVLNDNFGNFERMTFEGMKFDDLNGDGIRTLNEPGLEGWMIELDMNGDGVPEFSTVTDEDGRFRFENIGPRGDLNPGEVVIREIQQDDYLQTAPATGVYRFDIESGLSDLNVRFGNFELVDLSGVKFMDLNRDGVRDADEPNITNWLVELDIDSDGTFDRATLTDEFGRYTFTDVGPGTHTLREGQDAEWEQTFPAAPATHTLEVESGMDVDTLDFGNAPRIPIIAGIAFEDMEADGLRGPGDPGLQGVLVFLDANGDGILNNPFDGDNTGTLNAEEIYTFTAANGSYAFAVQPGAYRVRAVTPVGYTRTTEDPPHPGGGVVVIETLDQIFGPLYFGLFELGSVSGTKWVDIDGDGQRDDNDPPLEDVTVYFDLNNDGQRNENEPGAVTDSNGRFTLGGLGKGNYVLREVSIDGYVQTAPEEGSHAFAIETSGQTIDGLNFLNRPLSPQNIAVYIDNDQLSNGQQQVIDFGSLAIDDASPVLELVLENTGNRTLTIASVSLPDGFSITPLGDMTLSPGGFVQVELTIDTSAAAVREGEVVIVSDDPDDSEFIFKVRGEVTVLDRPDLTLEVASLPTNTLLAGNRADLSFTVANEGTVAIKDSVRIVFYASLDDVLDGADVPFITLPAQKVNLKPGASKTLKSKDDLPATLVPGEYTVIAVIDPDNAIPESGESNNTAVSAGRLAVGDAFVDLSPVVSRIPGDGILGGSKISLEALVTNLGTVPAAGLVDVTFYASADGSLDGGDVELGTVDGQKFKAKPGQVKKIKLKTVLPNLVEGDYHVIASIGSTDGFEDREPGNNQFATSETFFAADAFIDLVGFIGALPDGFVFGGDRVKLEVGLQNLGSVDASGLINVTFYASTDRFLDGSDIGVGQLLDQKLKLKPGQSKTLKLSGIVPFGLEPGDYYLLAEVDVGNRFFERDELNNLAVSDDTFAFDDFIIIDFPFDFDFDLDLATALTSR